MAIINGNNQANTLVGTDQNDKISAFGGRDRLEGKKGNDTLDGGTGFDTLVVKPQTSISESFRDDRYRLSNTQFSGLGMDKLVSIEAAEIDGGAGDDFIDARQFSGKTTLRGTVGKDTIYGGSNDDNISNFLGRSTLKGFGGNDTLNSGGDSRPSQLFGGTGNDFLLGTGRLYGEAGNDTLAGGVFAGDILEGGLGNDLVIGGLTNGDTLSGGLGNDTIRGTALFQNGSFVKPSRLREFGDVNFTLSDSQLLGLGRDQLTNIALATLNGGKKANRIDASQFLGKVVLNGRGGNDSLLGAKGNDVLSGGSGGDLLTGNQGNDKLAGGDAGDRLMGGTGADLLTGGNGRDTLNGGNGADRFRFDRPNEGGDLIQDFRTGIDTIEVLRSGFGAGLQLGALRSAQFVRGSAATQSQHRFIFNSQGELLFDRDGAGGSQAILLADLKGAVNLAASDIVVR